MLRKHRSQHLDYTTRIASCCLFRSVPLLFRPLLAFSLLLDQHVLVVTLFQILGLVTQNKSRTASASSITRSSRSTAPGTGMIYSLDNITLHRVVSEKRGRRGCLLHEGFLLVQIPVEYPNRLTQH
jgi:hypothetical protein